MMFTSLVLGLAATALQTDSPTVPPETVIAVPKTSQSDSEIVVEAPPGSAERRIQLRELAKDIINRPRAGRPVSTYADPICPKVFGIPEREALAIEARMRANAEELGANRRNASANCKPNVSVIFVPSNEGTADQWFDDDSKALSHLLSYERRRILDEKGPVRSWIYDTVKNVDGLDILDATGRDLENTLDFQNRLPFASRLRSPIRAEILGSVVMIELARANGKTLTQLADYASMRTFANSGGIDPETIPAAPTILTLFQDENAPEELSTFDRSLISMLYDTSPNAISSRYYSNIAARAARLENEERARDIDE